MHWGANIIPVRQELQYALTGKSQGGSVCIYTKNWSQVTALQWVLGPSIWPGNLRLLTLQLSIFPPVQISRKPWIPSAAISDLQNAYPDGVFVVRRDFNQSSMKTVLPHFHQYVDFATREMNTVDLANSNTKEAFKAAPCAHLGSFCDANFYIQALAIQRKNPPRSKWGSAPQEPWKHC